MALHDGITVPSITSDELLAFQAKHFTRSDVKLSSNGHHEQKWMEPVSESMSTEETEVELGFYSDGTPRTLTDAQVAIFRHSEIEQLVKSYNQYLADLEDEEDENSTISGDGAGTINRSPLNFLAFAETVRDKHLFDQARKNARSDAGLDGSSSQNTSRSHKTRKRNLEKRRARNKRRKLEKTTRAYQDEKDQDQRTYRRIAREMDEETKGEDEAMLEY